MRQGNAWGDLYSYKWQQARIVHLREFPLCVECEKHDTIKAASVVDHIKPHKGDLNLFWDRSNWQSLCKKCHDSYKQRLEKSGTVAGCDIHGIPLDKNHHWNK